MGKKLLKVVAVSLFAVALLFGGYSCSDNTPYPDDYLNEAQVRRMIEEALRKNNEELPPFTNWEIVNIQVKQTDWKWNDLGNQWEAIYNLPELDKDIYEIGATLGYVFIQYDNGGEVQKLLPYVDTYYAGDDANGNPVYFTETISFDYQFGNPSTVAFFIKDSQLAKDPGAPRTLDFRIVMIW